MRAVVVAVFLLSSVVHAEDSAEVHVPADWTEEKAAPSEALERARSNPHFRGGNVRSWKAPDGVASLQFAQFQLEVVGDAIEMIDKIEQGMQRGIAPHMREVSRERKDRLTRVVINQVFEIDDTTSLHTRRIYMVDPGRTLHQVIVACVELTANKGSTCAPIFARIQLTADAVNLKNARSQAQADARTELVVEVIVWALLAAGLVALLVRLSRKKKPA